MGHPTAIPLGKILCSPHYNTDLNNYASQGRVVAPKLFTMEFYKGVIGK